MVDVTTRASKGSPLTNAEIDENFSGLDSGKQPTLVSGVNIKTLNGVPVLGAGNIALPLPTVSDIAPASPSVGDLWVDSSPDGYDSGWITVSTFLNSFTASPSVKYRKIGNRVDVVGTVQRATMPTGLDIFTLPVGFRPTVVGDSFLCAGTDANNFSSVVMLGTVDGSTGSVALVREQSPIAGAMDSVINFTIKTSFLID